MRRLAKTGSYWICHIGVAILLTYLITGNWAAALAIGVLEPTVQAVVYFLHEWAWEERRPANAPATMP